jgi:phage-related protein
MKVIPTTEVISFIDSLELKVRGKIRKRFIMLEEFGHMIRMPYSRYILPGIFELRTMGKDNVRLIYTFKDNEAIVFHVFLEKTESMTFHEISIIKQKFNNLHL